MLVLELVALWKSDDGLEDGHDLEVSCGWGACLAFQSDACDTDFNGSKKSAVKVFQSAAIPFLINVVLYLFFKKII